MIMSTKHRISAPHRKGTPVFYVDDDLSSEIASRGGHPAIISVTHNPSPTWPGTTTGRYSVAHVDNRRLKGCYLIDGTDADYEPGDTLVLEGLRDPA
jgi:hypothetical protein